MHLYDSNLFRNCDSGIEQEYYYLSYVCYLDYTTKLTEKVRH